MGRSVTEPLAGSTHTTRSYIPALRPRFTVPPFSMIVAILFRTIEFFLSRWSAAFSIVS
jgi:hypothetical protein